jgi:hypothetical protein
MSRRSHVRRRRRRRSGASGSLSRRMRVPSDVATVADAAPAAAPEVNQASRRDIASRAGQRTDALTTSCELKYVRRRRRRMTTFVAGRRRCYGASRLTTGGPTGARPPRCVCFALISFCSRNHADYSRRLAGGDPDTAARDSFSPVDR